jgi:peptide/nickel transport system permease protein
MERVHETGHVGVPSRPTGAALRAFVANPFIRQRLMGTAVVIVGVVVVAFAFVHLLPGDPATVILGQHPDPSSVAELRQTLGLDRPIWDQFGTYVSQLVQGNLGRSLITGQSVASELFSRFPATIELGLAALIVGSVLGVTFGRLSARKPGGMIDGALTGASLVGVAIPVFILGPVLQYVFAVKLHVLSASGQISPTYNFDARSSAVLFSALVQGQFWAVGNCLEHLILPTVTLATLPTAMIARITRASVLGVAESDYVRTARAKGLSPRRIERRHVMRNAWLPVSTLIGLQCGLLLAGAVITETVFTWNGVGSLVVEAINTRDYLVVQGAVLVFALIFVVVNLVVDITYTMLDPRIRLS